MSSRKPSRYQLLQWINLTCGAHDMICDCPEPTKHLLLELTKKQEIYTVTKKEKQQIEKCLTTIEDPTEEDDGGFGPGDLDALFGVDDDGEDTKG